MENVLIMGVGMTPLGSFPHHTIAGLTGTVIAETRYDPGCAGEAIEATWCACFAARRTNQKG